MTKRNIDVVFSIPDYDDYSTTLPITRISDTQLKQLQKSVTTAKLPKDACPSAMSIKYEDDMSFMLGGARQNHMAYHRRILEISNLFYLREFGDFVPACGKCRSKSNIAMMRHCARNLRTGKCKDEFMRATLGATLFPQFYAKKDKLK